MDNKLDISALEKAAQAFDNALAFARKVEEKPADAHEFYEIEVAQSAVIKHFEFTYELCWKIMKRYIEMDSGSEEADVLTRKDLFRLSAEKKLIASFAQWVKFHEDRNRTSHVYHKEIADEVYETAKQFAGPLHDFIAALEKRFYHAISPEFRAIIDGGNEKIFSRGK